MISVNDFFKEQLAAWPEAAARFEALDRAERKYINVDGLDVGVQYNPARIRSSAAKVDKSSVAARPCFLCDTNRPAEQRSIDLERYKILVNPFPIGRFHLTIVAREHTPQLIAGRIADMAELAHAMPGCVIFYNGPRCGASAPDHFHFQAIGCDELPIVKLIAGERPLPFGVLVIDAYGDWEYRFNRIMAQLPKDDDEEEPKVNILCFMVGDKAKIAIIPRRAHRPDFYGDGEGRMLVSPASLDLGGMMVAPRKEDFEQFSAERIREIYKQLCYSRAELDTMLSQPEILRVGIVTAREVTLRLVDGFPGAPRDLHIAAKEIPTEGMLIESEHNEGVFEIADVTIGIGFHWERKETQRFIGSIQLLRDGDNVVVVNLVDVETYLKSVISSEMSATASLELLKAHAVISRSWVLAQIHHRHNPVCRDLRISVPEIIRWYDQEDHTLFDVCADDHCQRYQGITRQTTPRVAEAVEATRGEVLTYGGHLCDARFSKCCGGTMELFSTCWEDTDYPYLQALPDPFCNTSDPDILGQVLNNYDRETPDFYRWRVEYTEKQLSELVSRKSGIDFGEITDLEPLQRGPSGRIIRLKIVGTKRTVVVGKELEIRKWLSESHLYSSAFTVERQPGRFILNGKGWGHGVGLCQIGAAVMGERGFSYRQILSHYYPGATISSRISAE